MERLDTHEPKPKGMDNYLSHYGWHFSKAMAEWAISRMRDRKGNAVRIPDKQALETQLKENGIDSFTAYDAVYLFAMIKADYFGSSITTEAQAVKLCADMLTDPDAYEGQAFTRFYADCIGKGEPLIWEDLL